LLRLAASLAAAETLNATTGVDQLLPPGVKGVAVRADLDVDLALSRTRRELIAAGAADVSFLILRMDIGLHKT